MGQAAIMQNSLASLESSDASIEEVKTFDKRNINGEKEGVVRDSAATGVRESRVQFIGSNAHFSDMLES